MLKTTSISPKKITCVKLKNAASVSRKTLTTECTLTYIKEENGYGTPILDFNSQNGAISNSFI